MSAFTSIVWAEQQKCGSPLEKLILVTLAGRVGAGDLLEVVVHQELAEYCCSTADDVVDAIEDLCRRRLLWSMAGNRDEQTIAFPWWRSHKQFPTLAEETETFAWPVREALMTAQQGKCWYCGIGLDDHPQTPHIDHQVPKSRGGPDTISNLVLACAPCNTSKNARTVSEYRKFVIQRDRKPKDYTFHWEYRG